MSYLEGKQAIARGMIKDPWQRGNVCGYKSFQRLGGMVLSERFIFGEESCFLF